MAALPGLERGLNCYKSRYCRENKGKYIKIMDIRICKKRILAKIRERPSWKSKFDSLTNYSVMFEVCAKFRYVE